MGDLTCTKNKKKINCSKLLKIFSSCYTKYRSIAFDVKENQNVISFVYYYFVKKNQSELSYVLVSLYIETQPIRIQHFLRVNCFSFLKNVKHYLNNVYKKHLNFLELFYKKKEKNPIEFLIDEIDVDSYFFRNFLDVYVVQNTVIRQVKVYLEKLTRSKSVLLIHILRIKASNLQLNYTS